MRDEPKANYCSELLNNRNRCDNLYDLELNNNSYCHNDELSVLIAENNDMKPILKNKNSRNTNTAISKSVSKITRSSVIALDECETSKRTMNSSSRKELIKRKKSENKISANKHHSSKSKEKTHDSNIKTSAVRSRNDTKRATQTCTDKDAIVLECIPYPKVLQVLRRHLKHCPKLNKELQALISNLNN